MPAFTKLFLTPISALPLASPTVDRLRAGGVETLGELLRLSVQTAAILRSVSEEERLACLAVLREMGLPCDGDQVPPRMILDFSQASGAGQLKLVHPVKSLRLPKRAQSLFAKLRVEFVGELIQYTEDDLLSRKNVGRRTVIHIRRELKKLGLTLGTLVTGWDKRAAGRIASSRDAQLTQCGGDTQSPFQPHLEGQLADVLGRFASERWVQIAMKFYGFDGSGQKTLEAVGQEFGLTRERIRQITSQMRDRFPQRLKLISLPGASHAMEVLQNKIPCTVEELMQALVGAGITSTNFDVSGLAAIFEFDNENPPFEIVELEGGARLVTPRGTGEFVGQITSKAGKLVSRWGVTTVSEVCSQLGTTVSPELARQILNGCPDIAWLDDKRNWFTLVAQKRNRLLNLIKKVLSVASQVQIDALRKAVGRSHRMKGFAPPRAVLTSFCAVHKDIRIEEGTVRSVSVFICFATVLRLS